MLLHLEQKLRPTTVGRGYIQNEHAKIRLRKNVLENLKISQKFKFFLRQKLSIIVVLATHTLCVATLSQSEQAGGVRARQKSFSLHSLHYCPCPYLHTVLRLASGVMLLHLSHVESMFCY